VVLRLMIFLGDEVEVDDATEIMFAVTLSKDEVNMNFKAFFSLLQGFIE